jgi:hypothetical protein
MFFISCAGGDYFSCSKGRGAGVPKSNCCQNPADEKYIKLVTKNICGQNEADAPNF